MSSPAFLQAKTHFAITLSPATETEPVALGDVPSVTPGLIGVYSECEHAIRVPDLNLVRGAIPKRLRRAFDRGRNFWFPDHAKLYANGLQYPAFAGGTMALNSSKGKWIGSIQATPFVRVDPVP